MGGKEYKELGDAPPEEFALKPVKNRDYFNKSPSNPTYKEIDEFLTNYKDIDIQVRE